MVVTKIAGHAAAIATNNIGDCVTHTHASISIPTALGKRTAQNVRNIFIFLVANYVINKNNISRKSILNRKSSVHPASDIIRLHF